MYNENEKVFYQIYPLGFCGAAHKNDYSIEPIESLLKILDWIPHFKYLGITSLYLGPVFESVEHGYDTTNYFMVDRRLGTNETLKKVVNVLHENEIEVILDGVFNHVGRDFFAFKDVQNNLGASKYVSWFDGIDFSKRTPYNDPFSYKTWDGHYNLVKFNLKNPETANYLLDVAKYWIDEFNIDGIRLDAADCLDFKFLQRLSEMTKDKKDNFWLMGEVVHGDYNAWINEGKLDSITNYECYKGLYSSLNDKNYFEIAHSLKRQFGKNGIYENHLLYNFADNHDVNRVMTSLENENNLKNLYTMMFAMPGIPSIYYGSEWRLEGNKGSYNDLELRPSLEIDHMNHHEESDLVAHLQAITKMRKDNKAVKYGNYKEVLVKSEQIAFAREFEDQTIVAVLNSANQNISLDLKALKHKKYYDVMENREIELVNGFLEIEAFSSRILRKI